MIRTFEGIKSRRQWFLLNSALEVLTNEEGTHACKHGSQSKQRLKLHDDSIAYKLFLHMNRIRDEDDDDYDEDYQENVFISVSNH